MELATNTIPESPPLDSLKTVVQIVDDLLSCVQDTLGGGGDLDSANDILDAARGELWHALSAHIDGVQFEWPHYTDAGRRAALTYSDGSPVQVQIELRDGALATYRPRRDGDRDEFIETLSAGRRPSLSIVPPCGEVDQ